MALQDVINQLNQGQQGDWGFDPTLSSDVNTLVGQATTGENQFDINRQQINTDYGQFEQQNQQNQGHALQGLKDRYGWTGLINSGVYLKNQGDVGNEFQQMLQAAAQRRTRGLSGIDQQQSMFENSLLSALGQSRAGAASRYGQSQQAAASLAAQNAFQQQMLQMQQQYNAQQEALMRRLSETGQYQPPAYTPPPPPPPAPGPPPGPPPGPNQTGIDSANKFIGGGGGSDFVGAYNFWAKMNGQPAWDPSWPIPVTSPHAVGLYGGGGGGGSW